MQSAPYTTDASAGVLQSTQSAGIVIYADPNGQTRAYMLNNAWHEAWSSVSPACAGPIVGGESPST